MDDANTIDSELMELVVQICTPIGIIMEDVVPQALSATAEGLQDRVSEVAGAIQVPSALAEAAEALLAR